MCEYSYDLRINAEKRRDPTGTLTIRSKYESDMRRRFKWLKRVIWDTIVTNDAFQLKGKRVIGNEVARNLPDKVRPKPGKPAVVQPARKFDFAQDTDKIEAFLEWLRLANNAGVLEIIEGETQTVSGSTQWQNLYIRNAYQKGLQDAENNLSKQGINVQDGAIRSAFSAPIHADRVALLYTRAFNQLKGITDAIDTQISRILADGFSQGLGPEQIARRIAKEIDSIELKRARVLARTEIIRTHAESTLNAYESMGIEEVIGEVEFSNTGDKRVCPICKSLGGRTYTIEEARGVIPVHPNCRCAWLPVIDSKAARKREAQLAREKEVGRVFEEVAATTE